MCVLVYKSKGHGYSSRLFFVIPFTILRFTELQVKANKTEPSSKMSINRLRNERQGMRKR